MIVDTSVWIDHFRKGVDRLAPQLEAGLVFTHPFIIGELACGKLQDRATVLDLLAGLPAVDVADHDEVMSLVEREQLYGRGIGWIDAHLLTAARLSAVPLWTHDKPLRETARHLGVG